MLSFKAPLTVFWQSLMPNSMEPGNQLQEKMSVKVERISIGEVKSRVLKPALERDEDVLSAIAAPDVSV